MADEKVRPGVPAGAATPPEQVTPDPKGTDAERTGADAKEHGKPRERTYDYSLIGGG
jgi:hypothetical protein